MRPSPGVSISSASVATGSSPPNSGRPRTRLFHAPKWPRSPMRAVRRHEIGGGRGEHGAAFAVEVAGHRVERDARARRRARRTPACTTPTRPYATAGGRGSEGAGQVAQMSRPRCRCAAATRSGGKRAAACRSSARPSKAPAHRAVELLREERPGGARAGRGRRCRAGRAGARPRPPPSPCAAGRRRPACLRAARSASKPARDASGAVIRLPLEASGLAPSTRKKWVRSTSGTGISSWWPNISSAASMCGQLIDGGGGEARPRCRARGRRADAAARAE